MILNFHPDKNKSLDAARVTMEIIEARKFLLDPILRKQYDETYFENGVFTESLNDISTNETENSADYYYEYESTTEEYVEDDDYDEVLQVDEIRKEIHRHLDELLEIVMYYCEKFSKLNTIKKIYDFGNLVIHYNFFIRFAISDNIGNLKISSHHSSDFIDRVQNDYNVYDELKKYRRNTKRNVQDFLGYRYKTGKRERPSYAKWIQIKTHANIDDDLISYAKKIRDNMMNIAEKSVLYQNTILDKNISNTSDNKPFSSFGWGVSLEDLPDDSYVEPNPYRVEIESTPNMEENFYQKMSLELLLHISSLSRGIYQRCITIENQLNEFVNKNG